MNLRIGFLIVLAVAIGCNGTVLRAEASAEPVPAAAVDTWLESWAESGFLSGCLLVARGDAVLYERCFGEANAELGIPNSPTTRFAIASITKALQQVLLARLVDAGALSLEDPVSRWIEDFPRGDEITVLQLATHRAAVPHRVTTPAEEIFPRTAADMVALVREKGLDGEPGGDSSYSSAGYSVLARVLEQAGGASWEDLMQREVFDPAGMEHTVHPAGQRLIPGRASSYRWTPAGYRLTDPKDLSFLVGAGSLYSTPRDLFGFVQTVVAGGFGPTAREYLLEEGDLSSNGLTNGYRAFVDHDSTTGLSVIVCANVVTGALAMLRDSLPAVFAGEDPPAVELPDVAGMAALAADADFTRYEGRYELRPGRNLGVRSAGSYLDVDGWMLLPMGPDTFFCVQDFGKVVFRFDAESKVDGLTWGQDDFKMPRVGDLE
jgi:CubicO group peptidase (beta-lactamase class C family)